MPKTPRSARRKEQDRAYRKTHADERREYNRQYCNDNREHVRQYMKDYKKNNVEKLRAYAREYSRRKRAATDPAELKAAKRKHYLAGGWLTSVLNAARHRAAAAGLEFTITKADVVVPERCPVFGTLLCVGANSNDSPSLDRVDNTKGYIPSNVRVISKRANRMKGDASLEDLQKLIQYIKGEI